MQRACLHLPLDFERRESVRLLGRKLSAIAPEHAALAPLYALRIWMDWGMSGRTWRPLGADGNSAADATDAADLAWDRFNLTFVLNDSARWTGGDAELLRAAVDSGFIRLESRDGEHGLVLDGFGEHNAHLSPDFRTIQQRGAAATNAKKAAEEIARAASTRRQLFEAQNLSLFDHAAAATPAEQEACYALFMRLHRCCGLDLPSGAQYAPHAMADALKVIRAWTPEQIGAVEQWILLHRHDTDFVKAPARILEDFDIYLGKIKG